MKDIIDANEKLTEAEFQEISKSVNLNSLESKLEQIYNKALNDKIILEIKYFLVRAFISSKRMWHTVYCDFDYVALTEFGIYGCNHNDQWFLSPLIYCSSPISFNAYYSLDIGIQYRSARLKDPIIT